MKSVKKRFSSSSELPTTTSPLSIGTRNSLQTSGGTTSERELNQQLLNSAIAPPTSGHDAPPEPPSSPLSGRRRLLGLRRPSWSKKDKPQPSQPISPPLAGDFESDSDDELLVGFPNSNPDDRPHTTPSPKTIGFTSDTTTTTTPFTQPVDFTPNTSHTTRNSTKNQKKLDKYGFITNIDDQGVLRDDLFPTLPGGAFTPSTKSPPTHPPLKQQQQPMDPLEDPDAHTTSNGNSLSTSLLPPPTSLSLSASIAAKREARMAKKLAKRREKKWADMIAHWPSILTSPPKYSRMRSRVRKGIPNSVRGQAWANISKAAQRCNETEIGVYEELIRRSCGNPDDAGGDDESEEEFDSTRHWYDVDSKAISSAKAKRSTAKFKTHHPLPPNGVVMKDTIERDINRTFPRHSMFYDSATDTDEESSLLESEGDESTDTSYDRISEGDMSATGNGTTGTTGQLMMTWGGGVVGDMPMDHGGEMVEVLPLRDWNNHNNDETTMSPSSSLPIVRESTTIVVPPNGGFLNLKDTTPPIQNPILPPGMAIVDSYPTPSTKEAQEVVAAAAANRAKMIRMKKQKEKDEVDLTVAKGGQASLRRVLRAYSIYDVDVGYCQGMNFIAAMFITYVSEEEAFWLLVAIMKDSPCRMRGLFGEGMSEAHQVLFVAQKLITQFLPRLSRHFAAENVDITMFATQWLLTMYTSHFPFDIVTRIWDCFLVEGWKVTYRVMLALLEGASAELMKLRFEDILGYLKDLPHLVDHDELMESTFKIPLRKKHLIKYAKQWDKMQKDKEKKIEKEKKKLAKEREKERKREIEEEGRGVQ